MIQDYYEKNNSRGNFFITTINSCLSSAPSWSMSERSQIFPRLSSGNVELTNTSFTCEKHSVHDFTLNTQKCKKKP